MLPKTQHISSGIHRLLIFIGMPASSKSTMAQVLLLLFQFLNHGKRHKEFRLLTTSRLISKELGDPHSQLRPLIAPHVPEMQKGKLLDSELTLQVLDKHIVQEYWDGGRTMLFDGCVRDIIQGNAVLETGIEWDVIHLAVYNEKTSLDRIARRALEENRLDDATPERVQERFHNYATQTFPVLQLFEEKNPDRVYEIDAALDFEHRVKYILRRIWSNKEEIAAMMHELRKPGTPANNYMRKTLGLDTLASPMLAAQTVTA